MDRSQRAPKKTSVLNLNAFNYVKNFVFETTSTSNTDNPIDSDNGVQSSDDGQHSTTTNQSNLYNSPIQSNDESEISGSTLTLHIGETSQQNDKHIKPNFKDVTKLLFKSEAEFCNQTTVQENFLKGCKWSPDGLCILTNSNDDTLRIFDFNEDLLNNQINNAEVAEIKPSLLLGESSGIYDYSWYPLMNSYVPETACIFVTSKNNPIHLFDAYTGVVRCSYQGYNHLDELDNAYSIAFNPTNTHLYCGYRKCIKIFDISRPGKNFEEIKVGNYDIKLPGIISSISFSHNGSYAAATYTKYIGIYIESNNQLICMLQGHTGGVTHLSFSPDGNYLFSGARKDSDIYCWDMRNPGHILKTFKRVVETNQRIYFDNDKDWKYLCSGNNDGTVNLWNLNITNKPSISEYEPIAYSFKAHNDCVNGVSFHPTLPVLATSSGQRKFTDHYLGSCSSDDEDSIQQKKYTEISRENSLKFWYLNNELIP